MLEKLIKPLANQWDQKGFKDPTEIQAMTFEPITQGAKVVGISPTGTGKTLAYLLPLLNEIRADQTLQVIVLAPSQELAVQITNVARDWVEPLGVEVLPLIGGANVRRQIDNLSNKPEIVVGTPGRLNELAQRTRRLRLHEVETLVLDEADYFLRTDNHQTVAELRKRLRRSTRTLYFSATYGKALQDFIHQQTLKPEEFVVDATRTGHNIEHLFIQTTNRQKFNQLRRLAAIDGLNALVFFEQINELEVVAERLAYHQVAVGILHGLQSSQERELALRLFRQGQLKFLLTTDMAARGLDIAAVPMVIHYNRVHDLETYLHRSGRTGRMGQFGQVLSLVNEQEHRDLVHIVAKADIVPQERVTFKGEIVPVELSKETPDHEPAQSTKRRKRKQAVPKRRRRRKNRHKKRRNKGRPRR